MSIVEAALRVVIDGQAFLYAQHYKLMAELLGQDVTPEQLEGWEDEWKEQSSELIQTLIDAEEESEDAESTDDSSSEDSS